MSKSHMPPTLEVLNKLFDDFAKYTINDFPNIESTIGIKVKCENRNYRIFMCQTLKVWNFTCKIIGTPTYDSK